MIEIQKQTSIGPKIDQDLLEFAISKTLEVLQKPPMDITLRLTNDAEMRQLNQTFRGIAKTTDVLSFNQDFIDPETTQLYLGDIIISVERAAQQAHENNHTLDEECAFLAIHGTLHLLGYDHYAPDQKEEMWQLQDKIFTSVIATYQKEAE